MKRLLRLLILMGLLATFSPLAAQNDNPYAIVIWPPPTFVINGQFSIYGTANAPGMTGYYFEFRPLVDSETPAGDNVQWNPATLPTRNAVINGVLGVWDTTQIPDGLYELRLVIFTSSGQAIYTRVSPLRVMNTPSPFMSSASIFATQAPPPPPTQPPNVIPQPTTPASTAAEVIATISANVRAGDSTGFAAIGALAPGQHAPLIGVSAYSTWWQIQLPDGRIGWVAPSVVQVAGNWQSVPRIVPPRPTATNTPVAIATPTSSPAPSGPLPDAAITAVRIDIGDNFLFQQGFPFTIIVTVVNNSPVPLPSVSVACNFTPINNYFSTTLSGLQPFGQTDVRIPATIHVPGFTTGQQVVTANCAVDVNNLVAESDESNNFKSLSKELES